MHLMLSRIKKLSHPVRVRGLKPEIHHRIGNTVMVAPRAGAWIETVKEAPEEKNIMVAPRAGAWIETLPTLLLSHQCMSHPVRVRGLKLRKAILAGLGKGRTPCGCVD